MEELKLTFVNVGYGEAMVLECPDPAFPGGTFVMVIDGGSAEPEEYQGSGTGRIPLDQYLSLRGVDHIDVMAATHVHEDHLCGLLPVADRLRPGAFWQTLPGDLPGAMRQLADLVSLVRFEMGEADSLQPFADRVNYNFQQWTFRRNAGAVHFTPEQMEWLQLVKDHIAASLSIQKEDLELSPFDCRGGLGRFYQVFGRF